MRANAKKIIGCALATLTLFAGVGCGGDGTVTIDDLYVPTYADSGKSVRAMSGMIPNATDRAQLELYKAAGFNLLPYTEDFFKAADVATMGENSPYLKGLKLCEEYGIDVLIEPHGGNYSSTATNNPCYYEQYFCAATPK